MSFAECCSAYKASADSLTNGITGHSVDFKELAVFDSARRAFSGHLDKMALQDNLWERGKKILAEIHSKLARAPYRPHWLVSELLDKRQKKVIISELIARIPNVDPVIQASFSDVLSSLEQLRKVERNPLCTEIEKKCLSKGRIVFVLKELQFFEEARACLAETIRHTDWEMVRPSSLREMRRADRVIIFSPAWLLRCSNQEYLARAPIAGDTHLLACRHEFGGKILLSLLDEKTPLPFVGETENSVPGDINPAALTTFRDESRFRIRLSVETEMLETGGTVKATPFKFTGGQGAFFSRETNVWIAVADSNKGPLICNGVEKIPAEDLEPGDLLLMTTSGGGDMIPPVADMILGAEAKVLRETQLVWKAALREAINKIGTQGVASQLKIRGLQRATPSNIRNWCNAKTIGMEDLEGDLSTLLEFVGMGSELEKVAHAIEKIRRAHTSAGRQLQQKLRDSLHGKDLSGALEKGLEIRQGSGPACVVFQIEERGSQLEIPEEREGEIGDVED